MMTMNIFQKIFLFLILIFITCTSVRSQTYSNFSASDLYGNNVTLDSLLDRCPVFISFWATWCEPGLKQMKFMQSMYDKYKEQGFTYIAVNEDNPRSSSKVEPYIRSRYYDFPVVIDTGSAIYNSYSVLEMPSSFFINSRREIVYTSTGFIEADEKKTENEIQKILVRR